MKPLKPLKPYIFFRIISIRLSSAPPPTHGPHWIDAAARMSIINVLPIYSFQSSKLWVTYTYILCIHTGVFVMQPVRLCGTELLLSRYWKFVLGFGAWFVSLGSQNRSRQTPADYAGIILTIHIKPTAFASSQGESQVDPANADGSLAVVQLTKEISEMGIQPQTTPNSYFEPRVCQAWHWM